MRNPIMQWFHYEHLPPALAEVSKPFCTLAVHMEQTLPACAETTAGLRKLLEAKDCAMRAAATTTQTDHPAPREVRS